MARSLCRRAVRRAPRHNPAGIVPRRLQRFCRQIRPHSHTVVRIVQQTEQNTTGAGTQIQNPHPVMQIFKHFFYQDFRVLPGHEHIVVNLKSQTHKFLTARNMLQGHTLLPALCSPPVLRLFFPGNHTISVCQQHIPVCAAAPLQKQPGIIPGIRYLRLLQQLPAPSVQLLITHFITPVPHFYNI